MPTTITRTTAKRRQPACAPARRQKAVLSDARQATKAHKKAKATEEGPSCSLTAVPPHPSRSCSPSPTIKVVGFSAPDSTPIIAQSSTELLRKKQSAEFWAVIEGRSPRAPALRKAASFAGYPTSSSAPTGLGITVATPASPFAGSNSGSSVASTSRLPAPVPTLRKAASFPGYLPSAPKPALAAATALPLALSSLWKGKARACTATSTPACGTTSTFATGSFASPSPTLSSAAAAALEQVASANAVTRRAPQLQADPSAAWFSLAPSSTSSLVTLGARRPSSSSLRSGHSATASRPLRRMISYDSVSSTDSADEFQFDLDSALETECESEAPVNCTSAQSAVEDDDSEWESAIACSGSPASF